MKKIGLLIILISLLGCKDNDNSNNKFTVTFEAIFNKNDSTAVSLIGDKGEEITKIVAFVKSDSKYQRVDYEFPKNTRFSNIRLFVSSNKQQESLQIKAIEFKSSNDIIVGTPGDQFIYYFTPENGVEINFETGIHKLNHNNCSPSFIGNNILKKLIKEALD